jgi:hypothetical protein
LVAYNGSDDTTIEFGYRPPLLPVRIAADKSGVSVRGETTLVTRIGEFSVGAVVPVLRSNKLRVIVLDRQRETQRVYAVEWSDTLGVALNGRAQVEISKNTVLLDVTDGAQFTLAINTPRSSEQFRTSRTVASAVDTPRSATPVSAVSDIDATQPEAARIDAPSPEGRWRGHVTERDQAAAGTFSYAQDVHFDTKSAESKACGAPGKVAWVSASQFAIDWQNCGLEVVTYSIGQDGLSGSGQYRAYSDRRVFSTHWEMRRE